MPSSDGIKLLVLRKESSALLLLIDKEGHFIVSDVFLIGLGTSKSSLSLFLPKWLEIKFAEHVSHFGLEATQAK